MKLSGSFGLMVEGRLSLLAFWLLYWGAIVVGAMAGIGWVAMEEGWQSHMWMDLGLSIFIGSIISAMGGFLYWGMKGWFWGLWRSVWLAYLAPIILVEIILWGIFYFGVGVNFFWSYFIFLHTAPIFWLIYYWPCVVVLVVGVVVEGRRAGRAVLSDILDDL